ncbi:MAG: bifunctional phosphoribosylaminoimidazolecarboxamide formyltransferase/IMP cyclohydrolase [Methanotrichaceae archaeon]
METLVTKVFMQIRQVVVLADGSREINKFLSHLEEIGLEILRPSVAEMMSEISLSGIVQTNGSGRILVCDPDFNSTPAGSAIIKDAINAGTGVLMGSQWFEKVRKELEDEGDISDETRRNFTAQALYNCMAKDAEQLESLQGEFPQYMVQAYEKVQDLRYGENWHQKASLYRKPKSIGIYRATKLQGKEMSYNNVVDAEAALEMLIDLMEYDGVKEDRSLTIIVKHANPCGVGYDSDLKKAYRLALATDPKSAFGGVISVSEPVGKDLAEEMRDHFIEVLLAPGYDPEALDILSEKPNRRILDIGDLLDRKEELYKGRCSKGVFGGLLAQSYDTFDIKEWRVVTEREPTSSETKALRFAWKVTKYVKSNALVYATENQTIGIGSGQVSRVDSARFGAEKAEEHNLDTRGTVAATDSFFPFRDGLDEVYRAGATAVVHPGGSIRDAEVIKAADEHDMAMVFTDMRHFRH